MLHTGFVQVSGNPEIQNCFEKTLYTELNHGKLRVHPCFCGPAFFLVIAFFFFFYDVKQVPIHFQQLMGMLQHCFAVKLQNCFVYSETSSDFPLAWRRVDYDWIFQSVFGTLRATSVLTTSV